ARFPRARPAAGFALARRTPGAGQGQYPGPMARARRLLQRVDHALALDLHRRSGARRLRPEEDVSLNLMDATAAPLLSVRELSVQFGHGGHRTLAVDRISFDIQKGETVALVGESGSGKSVTALSVMKLLPYPSASHPSGSILFNGRDLLGLSERQIREVRGNDITIIFQEPMTSLNPLHTIERQIGEILQLHSGMSGS